MTMHRQGDILFVRLLSTPNGATAAPTNGAIVVLAEGETTGHAHAIRSGTAVVYEPSDPLGEARRLLREATGTTPQLAAAHAPVFLCATAPTPVEHEEHDVVVLEPGEWVVLRQAEGSDDDEPIQVRD